MIRLTARYVEAAKPVAGKRLEISDHVVRGLSLRISGNGMKTWALRYRVDSGLQRRLTLGSFPAMTLESARAAALVALGQRAVGVDPAAESLKRRRTARATRVERPQTLLDLWRHYDGNHLPKLRPATAAYQRWLWRKHIDPRLGRYCLQELDRASIKSALQDIGATAPVQANRALAVLRRMLNLAIEDEFLIASPVANIGRPFPETSRDRVLSDAELHQLWRALSLTPTVPGVSRSMCNAIKLILLTATRAGDVAGIHADEIDQAAQAWTIPARRFKGKRAHSVPLSNGAVMLLEQVFGATVGNWRGYAFRHAYDATEPMRRMSLSRAMQRIVAFAGLTRVTPHDLRRTAATFLASERVGVAPHILAAVLGHTAEGPAVTAIYNRHRYDLEKRAALTNWATLLQRIVTTDNIGRRQSGERFAGRE